MESITQEEHKYITTSIPKELIPSPLREYFIDVAERLVLPFETVATAGFFFLANLITDRLSLMPTRDRSYTIIPNLWGCIVAEKGSRKTPLFNAFTRPIYKYHKAYVDRFADEKEIYEYKLATLKSLQKKLIKTDGEEVDDLETKIAKLKKETADKPKSRYMLLMDTTKEKLTEVLSTNIHGIMIYQDEISRLLYSFEKDKEMRSLLLEGWAGAKPYTIGRIQRGDITVDKLTIGLFGGIQPEIYKELMSGSNIDSGFMDRFQLIVIAGTIPAKIADKEMNEAAYSAFTNLIENIINKDLAKVGKAVDTKYVPALLLTDDAKHLFKEFYEKANAAISEAHSVLRGFMVKSDKLIGSLALLFHVVDLLSGKETTTPYIGADTLHKAIEVSKFYFYQAVKAAHIGIEIETKRELEFEKKRDRLLNFMLRQKLPVRVREIMRSQKLKKNEAIQILEPYYYIENDGRGHIVTSQKPNISQNQNFYPTVDTNSQNPVVKGF
ncbi:MAG: DUF3987 domain-containing protein [Epsilonproteobacteria bacterium]|nr:DUF3987 domain-containing protein [Campylobacterota bacterium]